MSGSIVGGGLEGNFSPYSMIRPPDVPPVQPNQGQNPIATLQGLQGLQTQQLQNNQMLMQQKAKYAIGRAAQQAVDPTTGQLDEGKFNTLIAQDPDAAYMAQDIQSAQVARRYQEAQIGKVHLDQAMEAHNMIAQDLTTLYNDPNLTSDKVWNVAKEYVAKGWLDPATLMQQLGDVNSQTPPAALKAKIAAFAAQNEVTQKGISMLNPNWQKVDTGNGLQWIDTNNITNPGLAGPPGATQVVKGQSPESGAAIEAGPPNAQGGPTTLTRGQRAQMAGQPGIGGMVVTPSGAQGTNPYRALAPAPAAPEGGNPLLGAVPQGGGGPTSPGAFPGPNTAPQGAGTAPPAGPVPVRFPSSPNAPAFNPKDPNPAPNFAPQGPGGALTTGLGPGQAAAQPEQAKDFIQAQSDLQQQAETVNKLTLIGQMEKTAIDAIKTGAGTEGLSQAATAMRQAAALLGDNPTDDKTRLYKRANELLNKPGSPDVDGASIRQLFETLVNQQAADATKNYFGGHSTNQELNEFQKYFNSPEREPGASLSFLDFQNKLNEYYQTKLKAANQWLSSNPLPNWGNFQSAWEDYANQNGFGTTKPTGEGVIQTPGQGPAAPAAPAPKYPARPAEAPSDSILHEYAPGKYAWYSLGSDGQFHPVKGQ